MISTDSSAQVGHVEGRVLDGTIALAVDGAAPRTPATGTIELWLGGRGGHVLEAVVHDGAFRANLPFEPEWIDVGRVDLDGVACWSLPSWPDGESPFRAELVAHPVRRALARFVASESGAQIERVTLKRPRDMPGEPDALVLADAASPIDVPLFGGRDELPRGWIGMREYAVSAPGRALRHVWIDPSEGGARTFELEPEARLEVATPILSAEVGRYEVRLERDGRHPRWPAQRLDRDGVARIGGLPAGTWRVWMAEVSSQPDAGFEQGEVTLRAGALRRIAVGWGRARAPIVRSELRGTLRLPDGVDPASVTLSFRPAPRWNETSKRATDDGAPRPPHDVTGDMLVADSRDPRLLHWYAGDVQSGAWWISIASLGWSDRYDVADDALVAVVVGSPPRPPTSGVPQHAPPVQSTAAPPPGPLEVVARFVDGASGRELGPGELEVWIDARTAWSVHCALDESRWRLRPPTPRFRALARRPEDAEPRAFDLDVEAGERPLVLWPTQRIEVRAYDGNARIGGPEITGELGLVVEPVGHFGRAVAPGATAWRENCAWYDVVGPGRYRVELRDARGFVPHPPIEIEVEPGKPPPVAVFRLARAKR